MMLEKEYINRDDLIKNLNTFAPECYNALINDLIMKQPASDVAPVKHGEWQDCNGIFRCSECGYSFEHEGYKHFFHFCPSCGVRMDGEKNET